MVATDRSDTPLRGTEDCSEVGEDATTSHSVNADGVGGARLQLANGAGRTRRPSPGRTHQRDLLGFARVVVGVAYIGFVGCNALSCWNNAIEPRNHAFQLGTETVDYLVLACELWDGQRDQE